MRPDQRHVPDYEQILDIVRMWPAPQRLTFVQEVLSTLNPAGAFRPQHTLDQARGLLRTAHPAPSDADIAQLLDERRRERYER